jgi:hypothetical protein
MSSDLAVPKSAANLLNALGLGELAALTRDEALDAMPGELAAAFYGMCWMGDLEDQLLVQRYLLTNSTNQIELNNQGVEIWATREKIMKSQWPADEAKQQVIRDLLAADLATGTPADPPTPPLTQVVTSPDDPADDPDDPDDTPLEKLENVLKAQQAAADAVLAKLNDYADDGEAMVDWPTDASTEAGMSAWLSAQGVSQTDLSSDSIWLTDLDGTVVKSSDVATSIDFGSFPPEPSSGSHEPDEYQWVRQLTSADSSELVAWNGNNLLLVTGEQYDRNWSSSELPSDTVILNWSGAGRVAGTLYTAVDSRNKESTFFVPTSSTLGTVVPDNIGKTYTIDGKTVQLWSDGTNVYTVDAEDMTLATLENGKVTLHLNLALHVFKGDTGRIAYRPANYFSEYGGMARTASTQVITSVDGSRRAAWANVFEKKINALQTNTANFTSAIATMNIQVQDSLTNYNVAASWVTNMLKVWADMLNAVISKI